MTLFLFCCFLLQRKKRIPQLNALKNQPPQNGLKIKSVGSEIFTISRAQTSEADPPKDLPLPPLKETLVGDFKHLSCAGI